MLRLHFFVALLRLPEDCATAVGDGSKSASDAVDDLYIVSRLLLLLLTRDAPSRELAVSPDLSLGDKLVDLLDTWLVKYEGIVKAMEGAEAAGRAEEARRSLKVRSRSHLPG